MIKRYIELVYDNSGSMTNFIHHKAKYTLAQELFEKEILPSIGKEGDHIVLRLLGNNCGKGYSFTEPLTKSKVNNRKEMLQRIKRIIHDGGTPLFYTMADAIDACQSVEADEHLIFVLTDGDDTCQVKIQDIIDQELIDKYVKYYTILLVQLAVESSKSRNNLTAFTNYLGGQTIQLDSHDSVAKMRTKLKKALRLSHFSDKIPLERCFEKKDEYRISWEEVENKNILYHQALLLFHKNYLSWQPEINTKITALQLEELKFLYGLCFSTGLPDTMVASMLTQLEKPYYYSHDCIYWDFSSARWRYFIPQNQVEQLENPDALQEDKLEEIRNLDNSHEYDHNGVEQWYKDHMVYTVEVVPTFNNLRFRLRSERRKSEESLFVNSTRPIILKPGDKIQFEN